MCTVPNTKAWGGGEVRRQCIAISWEPGLPIVGPAWFSRESGLSTVGLEIFANYAAKKIFFFCSEKICTFVWETLTQSKFESPHKNRACHGGADATVYVRPFDRISTCIMYIWAKDQTYSYTVASAPTMTGLVFTRRFIIFGSIVVIICWVYWSDKVTWGAFKSCGS